MVVKAHPHPLLKVIFLEAADCFMGDCFNFNLAAANKK